MPQKNKSFFKRLTLSGFKSISCDCPLELDFDTEDRINILIGANGAGKSNFISFFNMLSYAMTGNLQNFIGQNGYANAILHFGAKKTQQIKASIVFSNGKIEDKYNFVLTHAADDALIFTEETFLFGDKKKFSESGHKESRFFLDKDTFDFDKDLQVMKNILSNCRAYQFNDTSPESHLRNTSNLNANSFVKSNGGDIATILYRLKENKNERMYYRRIVDTICLAFPQFDDFVLEPETENPNCIMLKCKTKNNDYIFATNQISDGSLRFIALATLLLQPNKPNVILIDEPELGLHPQAIGILAEMMKIASAESQIITTTQSPDLLNNFSADNVIVADYDKANQRSVFKRLSENELKDWLEEFSLDEIWRQNQFGGNP